MSCDEDGWRPKLVEFLFQTWVRDAQTQSDRALIGHLRVSFGRADCVRAMFFRQKHCVIAYSALQS